MIGEQIEGLILKLLFALGIWALQEFIIIPMSDKALYNYKRRKLKEYIKRFSTIKILSIFHSAYVEHSLNENNVSKEKMNAKEQVTLGEN